MASGRLGYNRQRARRHLFQACSRLAEFIDDHGPLNLRVEAAPDLFAALARAIIYQQLSGKAAGTIHSRFKALFESGQPSPDELIGLSAQDLRDAGLSGNKARSVLDLAHRTLDGTVPSRRRAGQLDDAELITRLTTIRGVGPWTVQMLLIFNLGRPDVMPATDLGVQKGVQNIYDLDSLPTPDEVHDITRHLAPYRSAAAWYFWRAADLD